MGENSDIEWTHHTFNPWIGCQKVGPGCDHCYAEALSTARLGVLWGPSAERRRTAASTWAQPRRWNRRAAAAGRRERVFCASLADVLDPDAPEGAREDLGCLVLETPSLDWLFLTKRIGNAAKMLPTMFPAGMPANVWLGATIVNQLEADRDIPKLLATPAAKRFLSMEPLLGPARIRQYLMAGHYPGRCAACGHGHGFSRCPNYGGVSRCHSLRDGGRVTCERFQRAEFAIDWVIVGGESGSGARPMHPAWARSLRDQCVAAGVPFLFKQWGEWGRAHQMPSGTAGSYAIATAPCVVPGAVYPVGHYPRQFDLFGGASVMERVGKKAAGRCLDGIAHDEVPA